MKKLILNSARCRNCQDVLLSWSNWDFKSCSCKRAWHSVLNDLPDSFRYRQVRDDPFGMYKKQYIELLSYQRGIFIDGGLENPRYGGNMDDFEDLTEYAKTTDSRRKSTKKTRLKK